jgi:predicted CopG family antitoxin
MGTKTIGLREDTYDWLQARKRDDESFTELVDRLLDEATADWRDGFGTLPESEAEELERAVTQSREQLDAGLSTRQVEALGELSMSDDESDEAA